MSTGTALDMNMNMTSLAEVGVILANTLTTTKKTDIYTQMAALHRILISLDVDGEKEKESKTEDATAYFPSLKACLVKLISSSEINACKHNGEILQSMAIRQEWIGCVVLLLAQDSNSNNDRPSVQGSAGVSLTIEYVIQQCIDVIFGKKTGTSVPSLRSAAMDLLVDLFSDINNKNQCRAKKILKMRTNICAPWSTLPHNIIHSVYKNWFRISQVNGSLRAAAVRLLNSVASGCISYQKSLQSTNESGEKSFCSDLISEKFLLLLMKLVKRALEDRNTEVRMEASKLSSTLAIAAIVSNRTKGSVSRAKTMSDPFNLQYLDEILQLSLQNIDDVSTGIASSWAEVAAKCLGVGILYGEKYVKSETPSNHDLDGDNLTTEDAKANQPSKSIQSDILSKFKAFSDNKKELLIKSCLSFTSSLRYLCELFVKAGGEAVANGCGGVFSGGGRKSRVGITLTIVQLMRLHLIPNATSKGSLDTRTVKSTMLTIMDMIGPMFERQMALTDAYVSGTFDLTNFASETSPPLVSLNKSSFCDAAIARLCVNRVLRQGLGCLLIESNQQIFLSDLAEFCQNEKVQNTPNPHQLQCALVEISHLVVALGDASIGAIDVLYPALMWCLSHVDYGVRYEAATALASIASSAPARSRCFTQKLMDAVRTSNDSISDLAQSRVDSRRNSPVPDKGGKSKRSTSPSPSTSGKFVTHQYSLHGHALALSMFLHEASTHSELVSDDNLFDLVGIAEILILCQVDEKITMINPGAACTCVRAGYSILSAALSSGPAIEQYVERIGKCWTRTTKCIVDGTKYFGVPHDVICLEALLSSIVSLLRFRSDFLLTIPGLLNRITLCLETLLALIVPGGRLGADPGNAAAETRLDNVKATIFEAFAWLPPGCFPVASETLYGWSLEHILDCTEQDIVSSLLIDAVSREDNIIGIQSIENASNPIEVGYWCDFTEALVFLSSSPAEHREREGIMHAPIWRSFQSRSPQADDFIFGSSLLGPSRSLENRVPPTPLHNIGLGTSWKEPPLPLATSKVRLIDSSIHIFATIFGLLDGRKQEQAMISLQELIPAAGLVGGKFNMGNALLTESEKSFKNKQEKVVSINLVTVILLSVHSLPLHEAATATDKGPPWMRRASDILFHLLLSSHDFVCRGSAEALSALALSTRGIGGGAHWFQQMIVDTLEDMSKGNTSIGKSRKASSHMLTRSKSSAMIALAFFQRQAFRASMDSKASNESGTKQSEADFLILSPLSTKVRSCLLSCIDTFSFDSETLEEGRYSALSLQILLSNSSFAKVHAYGGVSKLQHERVQVLSKVVHLAEKLFASAWCDTGLQDRPSTTVSLHASFMRLFMSLSMEAKMLNDSHPFLTEKLCTMATSILHNSNHPALIKEHLGFIYLNFSRNMKCVPNAFISQSLSLIYDGLNSTQSIDFVAGNDYCLKSALCLTSIFKTNPEFAKKVLPVKDWYERIFSLLERSGQKNFVHSNYYRSVVCGRYPETTRVEIDHEYNDLIEGIKNLLDLELNVSNYPVNISRKILLYKAIVAGAAESGDKSTHTVSINLTSNFASYFSTPRWQVKAFATSSALKVLSSAALESVDVLSLENAILLSCTAATATSNNEELPSYQVEGMKALNMVLSRFGELCFDEANENNVPDYCSSQVAAAIRQSLISDKNDYELFQTGCRCLRHFAISIKDIGMFRRLLRSILKPFSKGYNVQFPLFYRARVFALVDIRYMAEIGLLKEFMCSVFIAEFSDICNEVALASSMLIDELYSCQNDNDNIEKDLFNLIPALCFCALLSSDDTIKERAVPMLLAGFHHSLSVTEYSNNDSLNALISWIVCLNQLTKSGFVNNKPNLIIELSIICEKLSYDFLIPSVKSKHSSNLKNSVTLVSIIVTFIESVCSIQEVSSSVMLLYHASIKPLSQQAVFDEKSVKLVRSVNQLLRKLKKIDDQSTALIMCIFNMSSNIIESSQVKEIFYDEASILLQTCLSSGFNDLLSIRGLARKTALTKKWITWRLICSYMNDESGVASCSDILLENLDINTCSASIPLVIRELCSLTKAHHSSSRTIFSIMNYLGESIINVFQAFGTGFCSDDKSALMVCTDIVTILSFAFQVLSREESDELSQFITVCFKLFADMINVNGLPNQPRNGDVNKGRLCSVVLVHWARASPLSFKVCLSSLSLKEKGTVENAVRSELTDHRQAKTIKPRIILTPA